MARWRTPQIEDEKKRIKLELDSVKDPIQFALKKIQELQQSDDSSSRLSICLYSISALYRHLRGGGLKASQIDRLGKLAVALISSQDIKTLDSRLGHLFGDVYLALSQISLKSGELAQASWLQQLAFLAARRAPSGGRGFQSLSMGVQALRLGDGARANRLLTQAKEQGLPAGLRDRCILELMKSNRFLGENSVGVPSELSEEFRLEAKWEAKWIAVRETGDVLHLLETVRPGKSHCRPVYALESFLASRLTQSKEWMEKYPDIRSLSGMGRRQLMSHKKLYDAAMTFESCYDASIPPFMRAQRLIERLSELDLLPTIEHELLVLGAAARWFYRMHWGELFEFCVAEYEARCMRLSGGCTTDVLGLLKDIVFSSGTKSLPEAA